MKLINKEEFWKERIDSAVKEHYSVYVCNEQLWKDILEHHKVAFKQLSGKVLDAGCGYGRISEYIEDYTGVDFAKCFIDKAREKYPNKKFVQSKLENLPFKDKEFDWAVCVSIKKMVSDNQGVEKWLEMERELKRVAKKVMILEYEDFSNVEIL